MSIGPSNAIEPAPAGTSAASVESQFFTELAALGCVKHFARGQLLIREGSSDDTLYLIQVGSVRVFSQDAEGRQIVIDEHGPGEFVGEMALDGTQRSASVMATEATVTVEVARRAVIDYIAQHPSFALMLVAELSRRAKLATQKLKDLALKDVYCRLVDILNAMAVEQGARRIIPGKLNKSDLARRIGASRDMVTLIVRDLEQGGYLASESDFTVIARRLPLRR